MAALLTNSSNEFAKLDREDKLVCLEVLANNPKAIRAWVHYVTETYRRRDTSFSQEKLNSEINDFQNFLLRSDNEDKQHEQ